MSRNINNAGLSLIKESEGLRLRAYRDAVGVLTIGYGWTLKVDGRDIYPGMKITEEKAEELLIKGVAEFAQGVEKLCPKETTDNQFAAMVSLAYNIGLGGFSRSSVRRYHNQNLYSKAADSFLLWNKAGGKVLRGLVIRREKERALYLSSD